MTLPVLRDLTDTVDRLGRDPEEGAVLVTGPGTRAFCSGLDLHDATDEEFSGLIAAQPLGGTRRGLFETVLECPEPAVAAINGAAVGGGLELALATSASTSPRRP